MVIILHNYKLARLRLSVSSTIVECFKHGWNLPNRVSYSTSRPDHKHRVEVTVSEKCTSLQYFISISYRYNKFYSKGPKSTKVP